MTHDTDMCHELGGTVQMDGRDGSPLGAAPMQILRTAHGLLISRSDDVQDTLAHLDELSERLMWLDQHQSGRPPVHVMGREADSVTPLRACSAQGGPWWCG
jgi:hypothetical protein